MLNRYPLWKNLMVILVVAIGALYSLPNIYGEDPAVQISGTRGQQADTTALTEVQNVLKENNLSTKSIVLENGSILARFNNTDDQLLAKDKIAEKLGTNYTTALNLAPATPAWLSSIGANPMKWGLDLRGGVRFLMEVDMLWLNVKNSYKTHYVANYVKKKFNLRQLKMVTNLVSVF